MRSAPPQNPFLSRFFFSLMIFGAYFADRIRKYSNISVVLGTNYFYLVGFKAYT